MQTFKNFKKEEPSVVLKKEHIPVLLGHVKDNSFLFKKTQNWQINDYPLMLTGSIGSGMSEIIKSLIEQYIINDEGVICINDFNSITYSELFSILTNTGKLSDFYFLNFPGDDYKKTSHSLDPINPMVNDPIYFKKHMGDFGVVFTSILKKIHFVQEIISVSSLSEIIQLETLVKIEQEHIYSTPELTQYLDLVGLDKNRNIDINSKEKHQVLTEKANCFIDLINSFPEVFKETASVDLDKIFMERKVLLISINRMELRDKKLAQILLDQIAFFEKKYSKLDTHLQNIIIEHADQMFFDLNEYENTQTKNNFVFISRGYQLNQHYQQLVRDTKTHVLMKSYGIEELSPAFKLHLINSIPVDFNLTSVLNRLSKKEIMNGTTFFMDNPNRLVADNSISGVISKALATLHPGEAIVFAHNTEYNSSAPHDFIINNETKYYVVPLQGNLPFLTRPEIENIHLVSQPEKRFC